MTSKQQAVLPLTSVALRDTLHHAVELQSSSRRPPLPGFRSTLPVLRSELPVLHSYTPGLRPDLPGSREPLSGEHVPLPRGNAGELARGRDGRRSRMNVPGIMQGYSKMLLRPTPL